MSFLVGDLVVGGQHGPRGLDPGQAASRGVPGDALVDDRHIPAVIPVGSGLLAAAKAG